MTRHNTLTGVVHPSDVLKGEIQYTQLLAGYSAYEIAIQNGFVGTVDEWLRSLVGNAADVNTTHNWNSDLDYIPPRGKIVVYSDARIRETGSTPMPGIKIGDGTTPLVDLPFSDDYAITELRKHEANQEVHVAEADRKRWDERIRADVDLANETLILKIHKGDILYG